MENVAEVRDSPRRLPARFANELYQHGESGMGYTIFTVVFFPEIDWPMLIRASPIASIKVATRSSIEESFRRLHTQRIDVFVQFASHTPTIRHRRCGRASRHCFLYLVHHFRSTLSIRRILQAQNTT
jgi:hypothetical protein